MRRRGARAIARRMRYAVRHAAEHDGLLLFVDRPGPAPGGVCLWSAPAPERLTGAQVRRHWPLVVG